MTCSGMTASSLLAHKDCRLPTHSGLPTVTRWREDKRGQERGGFTAWHLCRLLNEYHDRCSRAENDILRAASYSSAEGQVLGQPCLTGFLVLRVHFPGCVGQGLN